MDSDLIYAKTASGEAAMIQRALVTQRNLRMLLILVDGQSTVADLCFRIGNTELATEALKELEKGGFIDLVIDQDSLWVESKKVEQEIRAAASLNPHPLPSPGKDSMPRAPRSRPPPPAPDNRVFVHSTPQGPVTSNFSISQYSSAPIVVGRASIEDTPRGLASGALERWLMMPFVAGVVLASSIVRGIRSALSPATQMDSVTIPPFKPLPFKPLPFKPVRRSRQSRIGWPMILVSTCIFALLLAFLTIVFFPYNRYLPDVEAAFSRAAGQPVKVGALDVNVYPVAALVLHNVRIGSGDDEIRVSEMRLQPVIGTLTASRKVFQKAVLSGVTLSADSIAGLSRLAAASAQPSAGVAVEQMSFEKADVLFGERVFTSLQGNAELSANGSLRSLQLRSIDRSLTLAVTPAAGRLEFTFEGVAWRPTPGSPFFFDSLKVQGDIDHHALTIRSMDLRLFEGLVQGVAIFSADKQPTVSGELWFERVNAGRLIAVLGMGEKIVGDATGTIRFSATSDSWSAILSAINADGEFTMRRGSLRGIDLAEAVRRIPKTPVQGGITEFEQLSGKIRLTATRYQLSGLVLNSGLMQSTGKLEVGKDDWQVSGKMDLKIRGTVNQTNVPLAISGSLEAPIVQVGKN